MVVRGEEDDLIILLSKFKMKTKKNKMKPKSIIHDFNNLEILSYLAKALK